MKNKYEENRYIYLNIPNIPCLFFIWIFYWGHGLEIGRSWAQTMAFISYQYLRYILNWLKYGVADVILYAVSFTRRRLKIYSRSRMIPLIVFVIEGWVHQVNEAGTDELGSTASGINRDIKLCPMNIHMCVYIYVYYIWVSYCIGYEVGKDGKSTNRLRSLRSSFWRSHDQVGFLYWLRSGQTDLRLDSVFRSFGVWCE